MLDLILEMLAYLGGAFLIGIVMGYLFWGWGWRRKLEQARIEGRASARTSMDGDAGLGTKLDAVQRERDDLAETVRRLEAKINDMLAEGRTSTRRQRPAPHAVPEAEADPAASNVTPLRLEPHMQSTAPRPQPGAAAMGAAAGAAAVAGTAGAEDDAAEEAPDAAPAEPQTAEAKPATTPPAGATPAPDAGTPAPDAEPVKEETATATDSGTAADAATTDKTATTDEAEPLRLTPDLAPATEPAPKPDTAATATSAGDPADAAPPPASESEEETLPVRRDGAEDDHDAVEDLQATLNELAANRLGLDLSGSTPKPGGEGGFQPWSVQTPTSVASSEPGDYDDLTRIDGVGAMTQTILNENGVYRYDQLAGFTPEDFVWLETVTDMTPGQIDQQSWIDQARRLEAEKRTGT